MRRPSNNAITLAFGATTTPYSPGSPHNGTDFGPIPDNRIYAPFAGRVSQVPNNGRDGNGTYMTDPQGRFHGFLHASSYLVPNGANVSEGQAIAVMGETGYAFGVHLHWAVKQGNNFIDPMSLVEEGEVAISQVQLDKLIKAMKRAEPNSVELNDTNWMNDPGLAIDTMWNVWGAANYKADKQPKEYVQVGTIDGKPIYRKGA